MKQTGEEFQKEATEAAKKQRSKFEETQQQLRERREYQEYTTSEADDFPEFKPNENKWFHVGNTRHHLNNNQHFDKYKNHEEFTKAKIQERRQLEQNLNQKRDYQKEYQPR